MVELGCWPGGWLQVLAQHVGAEGVVIGVDLVAVEALAPPVETLVGDICDAELRARVAALLRGPADLVLCDAAPKLSGIADVDRGRMEEIHEAALTFCESVLDPRGSLVINAFPGPEADAVRARLRQRFERVAEVRPEGRRSTSKEFYWIAGPAPPAGGRRGRDRRRAR